MQLFTKGLRTILIFIIPYISISQTKMADRLLVDYLSVGYDVRYIDMHSLDKSTLISGEHKKIFESPPKTTLKLNNEVNTTISYVFSPYDFENNILQSDTISNFLLSRNSKLFHPRVLNSTLNPIFAYYIHSVEVYKETLKKRNLKLDNHFIEAVSRLLEDLTIPGFVHHFGTHYAEEITYGGYYINRAVINKDEFVYSPYTKIQFKEKVSQFFEKKQDNKSFSDPFLKINTNHQFRNTESPNFKTKQDWQESLNDNSIPIDLKKVRLSRLLTKENFPNDSLLNRKREALDLYINFIELDLKKNLQKPIEKEFFEKFAIPFKQRLISILKITSGSEGDNTSAYTGDIFFGGFVDSQTPIKITGAIERGGVELKTLITDEKIEVNSILDYIVPHEHFENGFANVWDESQKLIKGVGRSSLVISGEPQNRIYFKEALRQKVQKKISLQTIDSDVYEVVFSLEHLNVSNEIEKLKPTQNYVMESELIAASTVGDISLLEKYHYNKINLNIDRLVKGAIRANQPIEFYNRLFDLKVKPTMSDLDLLFDTEYYNKEVALIFLERGAKPKNNMLFKAVAYRSPNVIKALIREGAEPANDDLNFALKLNDLELVSALTGKEVIAIADGQIVYKENNEIIIPQKTTETYVVKKGDYLGRIANTYKTTVKELRTWNNLKTNTIFVNQKLKIYLENPKKVNLLSENTTTEKQELNNKSSHQFSKSQEKGKELDSRKLIENLTETKVKDTKKQQETPEDKQQDSNLNMQEDSEKELDEALSLNDFIEQNSLTEQDVLDAILQNNLTLAIKTIENQNIKNEKILLTGVREGQLNVVNALLKNGTTSEKAIEIAIYYRHFEILKTLTDHGVNMNVNHLILSIKTDYAEGFYFFIEKGISPIEIYSRETPLHHLVMSFSANRLTMLEFLIDKNTNLNVRNKKGETPLHKAVKVGDENLQVIQFLLENGVDPKVKDHQGNIALELSPTNAIRNLIKNFEN